MFIPSNTKKKKTVKKQIKNQLETQKLFDVKSTLSGNLNIKEHRNGVYLVE
jgi:hypothetical protein